MYKRSRPAVGQGNIEGSIIDQLRKLDGVYHWERLTLPDKPPTFLATNGNLRSVHTDSVTKRSSRRRRHRHRGGDVPSLSKDNNCLHRPPWALWEIGGGGGDMLLITGGCDATTVMDSVEDSGKPQQLVEENDWENASEGDKKEIHHGASAFSLGSSSCSVGAQERGSDAGREVAEATDHGSHGGGKWGGHSSSNCESGCRVDGRASVAAEDVGNEGEGADRAGEASDDSFHLADFGSARGWTQGLKASEPRVRRRRFIPDGSDDNHDAVGGSEKPFDLCEQFREKIALGSPTCPAGDEVDEGACSGQENSPFYDWSGDDRTTGLSGDAHEKPQSPCARQAGGSSVFTAIKPDTPSDSSPGDGVLVRKARKGRRFILDDSEVEDPAAGGVKRGTPGPDEVPAGVAATSFFAVVIEREREHDVGNFAATGLSVPGHGPSVAAELLVRGGTTRGNLEDGREVTEPDVKNSREYFEKSVKATRAARRFVPEHALGRDRTAAAAETDAARPVTEAMPSRTSLSGEELGARDGESPAPRPVSGARRNHSSRGGDGGVDDDDDDECDDARALEIRRTAVKRGSNRRRFVVESSDSSADDRNEKNESYDRTAVVEGAAVVRTPVAGSEEQDSFVDTRDVGSREECDDDPEESDDGPEKSESSGDGSFALPEADARPTNGGYRKPPFPCPRLLQIGDSRRPGRRDDFKDDTFDSSEDSDSDSAFARLSASTNGRNLVDAPAVSAARISAGRKALNRKLSSPSAKRAQSRGRLIEVSDSSSSTPEATLGKLVRGSADESGIASADEQGRDRSTVRSPSGALRVPARRVRPPLRETRKGATAAGVKDSIDPSSAASDSDRGASLRDSPQRGSPTLQGSHTPGALSPARRPRGRGRNNGWKGCSRDKLPEEGVPGGLSGSAFFKARDSLAAKYFAEFNNGAFGGALSDVKVTWNNRLNRTAGITQCVRRSAPFGDFKYVSSVELSSKVLDTEPKLRETLLHELCHAAAWSIDHKSKPPHGEHFWAWARRAKEAHPGVPITICHSYKINFKYRYVCVGGSPAGGGSEHQRRGCGTEIGRHSKSIDIVKQVCGHCKGRLRLFGTHGKDGKLKKPRAASGFSLFVKENYAEVKGKLPPGTPQQRVMKEMSRRWAARDQSGRSRDDPGSIVDGLRALSLQPSPLPPPAVNACSGMKPDGGRKAGGRTGGLGGVGSGGKENSPGEVVDLT